MAEVVKMPRLSDTMEEGTVAKWHKSIGDKVEEGDLLAEIETDKATMDFESFQEGTLLHIAVEEGDTSPVESMLCVLGEEGEDIDDLLKGGAEDSADKKDSSEDKQEQKDSDGAESDKSEGASANQAAGSEQKKDPQDEQGRIKASPLAKKLAEEKGIELREVKGSGEGGRIVKRDIDEFEPQAKPAAAAASLAPAAEAPEDMDYEKVKVSQMRKTIARRLSESKNSAPHFYLTLDIDMKEAIAARKQINEVAPEKISFNDLVVKAAAVALKQHPVVNSSWAGDHIRRNKPINVGVAVAVEEGLLVPVIRHTDRKGLSDINKEVRNLAEKARDKKLQPEEMEGNTFTISNLGMFGIEEFTAIINAPDSCIMAVGGIKEVPVVRDGNIVPGNIMKVTLSCDHRVVDGATGAAFLKTFKEVLENPLNMLL